MISSIFGKTKPINYIILLSFLFLFYWFVHFFIYEKTYSAENLVLQFLVLGFLMFSIFVVNFIIKRNKVTDVNSFAILYYTILTIAFPETLLDNNAIFCSLFLLLATRRLISIRSLKNIKLKVFDATLWIMVSTLFYDWAVLYLLMVFAAIYIYEPKNIRNWLVPLAGIFTVFMIANGVLALTGNAAFLSEHYQFQFTFNKAYFLNLANSSKLVLYIVLIMILGIFAFLKLGKAGLGKIVTLRLIALSFAIGIIVKILTTSADDYPVMVTFFPAVVFITNYVEAIKRPNIKEMVLIASITVPILVLLTGLIVG